MLLARVVTPRCYARRDCHLKDMTNADGDAGAQIGGGYITSTPSFFYAA